MADKHSNKGKVYGQGIVIEMNDNLHNMSN